MCGCNMLVGASSLQQGNLRGTASVRYIPGAIIKLDMYLMNSGFGSSFSIVIWEVVDFLCRFH